jgi:hypothetical protein
LCNVDVSADLQAREHYRSEAKKNGGSYVERAVKTQRETRKRKSGERKERIKMGEK